MQRNIWNGEAEAIGGVVRGNSWLTEPSLPFKLFLRIDSLLAGCEPKQRTKHKQSFEQDFMARVFSLWSLLLKQCLLGRLLQTSTWLLSSAEMRGLKRGLTGIVGGEIYCAAVESKPRFSRDFNQFKSILSETGCFEIFLCTVL